MKKLLSLTTLLAAGSMQAAVWVSPRGDDAAAGTREAPFRTVGKAVSAVRAMAERTVYLADGVYELEETLLLGPEDSGLTVEALPGAVPVVSAGRRVSNWKVDGRGWWTARMPAGERFSQFYVNGVRRQRPYLPRRGYFAQDKLVDPEPKTGRQRVMWLNDDVKPWWRGLEDAEFCFFHTWTMSRMPPVAVDASGRVVTLAHPALNRQDLFPFGRGRSYRIDNLADALGEPGDWYLDRDGLLTYVPMAGETPAGVEAFAARLEQAVKAVGASDVVFRGIAFVHVNWNMPKEGIHCGQAAVKLPVAIETEWCTNVVLERCTVAHTGAWAVYFGIGSQGCAVKDCHLADLGAGGVMVGGKVTGGYEPSSRWAYDCSIVNTLIEHGGRMDPAGTGVWIGNARRTQVAHNTIHDMYYTGVSSGWRWALGPNSTGGSVIEWNHIHHIGQHVLSDMGGIYTLGNQPGTVERFNHIHHVDCQVDGNGIYFDSGSSCIAVSNNVVHDTSQAAWFMARISATNLVANNIFGFSSGSMIVTPERDRASVASICRNNIFVWDEARLIGAGATGGETDFRENLMWSTLGPVKERRTGFVNADPHFRNAAARDFAFADESVARSHGFVPFSLNGVGCGARPGNGLEVRDVPAVFTIVEPQVVPFAEDFENEPVGSCPWGAFPKSATNLVTVTDRTAASGRRSLEVVNSVKSWMPHFNVNPYRKQGKIKVAFALMVEKGASLEFSTRDPDQWINAPGPMFRVDAAANLLVGGKKLAQLPVGGWCRLELAFELGKARQEDVFTLRLKLPDEVEPRVFTGLAFSRNFRKMNWIGFMCGGCTKGERYYIDDFHVSTGEL